MKKITLLTMTLATAICLGTPLAGLAGIVGSPHDFSKETWNVIPSDPNSVCGVCHQPHNADSSVVPLWIHTTDTATVFKMYNTNNVKNSLMKAVPDSTPGGRSLACLSCHDGVIAVNSYAGGVPQGSTPYMLTNSALISADLTHTHPISFIYDSALATADGFLNDPNQSVLLPDSGTFNHGSDTSIRTVLLNGGSRMECSSCHDVHNQLGTPFDITTNPKLVKIVGTQGGKGSLLCRSCHIK